MSTNTYPVLDTLASIRDGFSAEDHIDVLRTAFVEVWKNYDETCMRQLLGDEVVDSMSQLSRFMLACRGDMLPECTPRDLEVLRFVLKFSKYADMPFDDLWDLCIDVFCNYDERYDIVDQLFGGIDHIDLIRFLTNSNNWEV